MRSSLFSYACRLLSRRGHSRSELERKLRRKAPDREVAAVLDRLEELNFLNDREFASVKARSRRVSSSWGNSRIRLDLKRLGVDARIIELTLEELEQEHPEIEGLRRAVTNWIRTSGPPQTISQLKKLFDHCLRRGYPPEMIRSELNEHFANIDRV